jgi:hypothetical protein
MIILLVGIPLALALRDLSLLIATIFSLIQASALVPFVFPFVWSVLFARPPDFSYIFVVLAVGWWLYFLLVSPLVEERKL